MACERREEFFSEAGARDRFFLYRVVERNHLAFRTAPQDIEQPLQKRRFSLFSSSDDRLALGHIIDEVIIPISQIVVELLLSSNEELGVSYLLR